MGFDLSDLTDATVYALMPDGRREVLKKIKDSVTFEASKYIKIRKVIFSGPATIVFWNDGDKTVVKCTKGDHLNYEMGIAMCTLKKLFGDSYLDFKKDLKKWAPEEKKDPEAKPWHIIVNTEDSKKIAKKPQDFAEAFAEFLRNWDEEHEENGNNTTSD